jgi:predicted nucleic-acid-binding protein
MKVAVDTNVLVRIVVHDDPKQTRTAIRLLGEADSIIVASPTLCELAWVLRSVYHFDSSELAHAIREVLSVGNVITSRAAADFGLRVLEAGGDFADGVIAYEGKWMGGEIFASFDRRAVGLLKASGQAAQLLS